MRFQSIHEAWPGDQAMLSSTYDFFLWLSFEREFPIYESITGSGVEVALISGNVAVLAPIDSQSI